MEAVKKAILLWGPLLRDKLLTVLSDNSTVVISYINREGGTRSPFPCWRTLELFSLADDFNIGLRASHLAGKENVVADALSRGWEIDQKEWTLAQSWADHVFRIYGLPHVDWFATAMNARLPTFCTRFHHPQAWAVDALSQDWSSTTGYAFPPWNLIYRVLVKLRDSQASLILIAPFWPRQPWFPLLLRLLVDNPYPFPARNNLLTQLHGRVAHLDIKSPRLTAWPISGRISEQKAFQRKLLTLPHTPEESPLYMFMTLEQGNSETGPWTIVSIPWKLQ